MSSIHSAVLMHINISMSSALPPVDQASSRRSGLPTPNSTHSYWHRDPSKTLLNHHTTEDLPSTADVVVIGSGISGTFAARELVAGGRSVVMLEAREACWGATGRVSLIKLPHFPGPSRPLPCLALRTLTLVTPSS